MKHSFLFMAIAALLLLLSCGNYKLWQFSLSHWEMDSYVLFIEVNNPESYVFRNRRTNPLLFLNEGLRLLEGRVWGN